MKEFKRYLVTAALRRLPGWPTDLAPGDLAPGELARGSACPLTGQVEHAEHHRDGRAHAEVGVFHPGQAAIEPRKCDPEREQH